MAAPRTKLFVGHLPDGCSNEELQALFDKYGSVKECDVINKYGFVHMSSSEEAEDAIKALNNFNFRGSSISVERSKSKLHPEPGAPGRAKSGPGYEHGGRGRGRGFRGRPPNGRFEGMYQRFDGPSYNGNGGGDYYQDRYGGGGGMSPRMRPYPSPYDRPSMGMPRDEYSYRSSPYSVPSRDPYARPSAPPTRELYERRAAAYPSTNDYLYSRRSPPQMASASRDYWYSDTFPDSASRGVPPTATRRPYF